MEPAIATPLPINSTNVEANQVRGENDSIREQTAAGKKVRVEGKILGGWATAFILLANQALATLAFFGVGVNLVPFLYVHSPSLC